MKHQDQLSWPPAPVFWDPSQNQYFQPAGKCKALRNSSLAKERAAVGHAPETWAVG